MYMSASDRRVLYLGGTGTISAACVRASVREGNEVHVVNRGTSTARPLPAAVHRHRADVRGDGLAQALGDLQFDAVVDFLCYSAADAERATRTFGDRTGQYVFISSATVY